MTRVADVLSKDERRFIAYRLAEGDSNRVIGEAISIPEATVRSFRRRLLDDSTQLHDFEFVMEVDLDGDRRTRRYLCRYCGNLHLTMWGAARHAIGHLR